MPAACAPTASNTSWIVTALSVEVARRDRAAVEHEARDVEARERHHAAGNRLVAADEDDEAVEAVAARDQLDRVGDHLAADERRAHALGAHRDAVGDRDRVELHRRAAGGADAGLHVLGEVAQVVVARADLDPRVGDADERLLQIGVGEADGLQHRARRRAARAGGQRIAAVAHDDHLERIGLHARRGSSSSAYEPSMRSIGANSARCAERARARQLRRARRPDRRRTGTPTGGPESAATRASSGRCRAARTRSAP